MTVEKLVSRRDCLILTAKVMWFSLLLTTALFLKSSWASEAMDLVMQSIDYHINSAQDEVNYLDEPKLLHGNMNSDNLQCLRLYSERRFNGAWSDMCSSNELLSHFNIFNTGSACAPKDNFWEKKRFWILFAEPQFRGNYIILSEKECVRNFQRIGLSTLGSVLKCTMDNVIGRPKIRCEFPPRPWRNFEPPSELDARQAVQRAFQMKNRVSAVSVETGGDNPETKFATNQLDKLREGALSVTNDESQ